jgi:hypothetical protein
MTTPQAPGAPEAGQTDVEPTAPGAQDPAPQQQEAAPTPPQNKPLGKPNQQAPGAPADKADTEPAKDDAQDVASLPDWAQKALKKARSDAGNARTSAKQQAAEEARTQLMAEISKTLGLNTDGEPTVDDLTAQVEELRSEKAELEAAQTESTYRDAVRTSAGALNADADALLDSAGFRDAVQGELDDEFTDDDLSKAVAKVTKEFAKKSRFAKTTAPARSGGEIPGGPPAAGKQRPNSLNEALGRAYGGAGN